jgi:hypothetical protein
MDKRFRVFLDLEETVIDSWDSGLLTNVSRIQSFLKEQDASSVTIFSFAVWNAGDQKTFEARLRAPLETALGCRIDSCPSVADFMAVDASVTGVHWGNDLCEFVSMRGKFGSFMSWCRQHHPTENCVLVDDVVQNIDVVNRDTSTVIRFLNVGALA